MKKDPLCDSMVRHPLLHNHNMVHAVEYISPAGKKKRPMAGAFSLSVMERIRGSWWFPFRRCRFLP